MADGFAAAREGDALVHSSMLADLLGGVLEVAATAGEALSYFDIAGNFFAQLWRPTVATAVPGAESCAADGIVRMTGERWSKTGMQVNFQSRVKPTGRWENNVHLDVSSE